MKCPHCSTHDSQVKRTTRPITEQGFTFGELKLRERFCRGCKRRFHTYEIQEAAFRNMMVLLEGKPPRRSLFTREDEKTKSPLRG